MDERDEMWGHFLREHRESRKRPEASLPIQSTHSLYQRVDRPPLSRLVPLNLMWRDLTGRDEVARD